MDEAIEHNELPELEAKEMRDIQLGEDYEVDTAITTMTRQFNLEAQDLDVDHSDTEKEAEYDNQEWTQGQYPTPDLSVLEAFHHVSSTSRDRQSWPKPA